MYSLNPIFANLQMFLCWAWQCNTKAQIRSMFTVRNNVISLPEGSQTKDDCTFSGSRSCMLPSIPVGSDWKMQRTLFSLAGPDTKWRMGRAFFENSVLSPWVDFSNTVHSSHPFHSRQQEMGSWIPLHCSENLQHASFCRDSSMTCALTPPALERKSQSAPPAPTARRDLDYTFQKALEEFCILPPTYGSTSSLCMERTVSTCFGHLRKQCHKLKEGQPRPW